MIFMIDHEKLNFLMLQQIRTRNTPQAHPAKK